MHMHMYMYIYYLPDIRSEKFFMLVIFLIQGDISVI